MCSGGLGGRDNDGFGDGSGDEDGDGDRDGGLSAVSEISTDDGFSVPLERDFLSRVNIRLRNLRREAIGRGLKFFVTSKR